jgi:Family of unknown function (DUF6152)
MKNFTKKSSAKNRIIDFMCTGAVALLIALPVFAHHAAAVYYDLSNGTLSQWMAEGGSRTVMLRRGWTGSEIAVGDTVTLHGHPSRDGSNIMHMLHVDLKDGRSMFAEDTDPVQINRLLEERRKRD